MITEPAPAKINLALHIRAKRPDGYHDLETLFAFARDGDVVTVAPAERDSFVVTGPFASALTHDAGAQTASPNHPREGGGPVATHVDAEGNPLQVNGSRLDPRLRGVGNAADALAPNLVLRARNAFRARYRCPPVAITLDKHLPIASGIGGGSADAAATLRALAKLNAIDLLDPDLFAIAAKLGADVPACLLGRPTFGSGKGEQLDPLPPFGDLPLLLVNPRVPLATAPMFAAWDGIDRGPIATVGAVLERAGQGRNDFTVPAIAAAPVIAEVLALLERAPGATLARMSGSGATCFALFDTPAQRDQAAAQADRRGWWTLATTLV